MKDSELNDIFITVERSHSLFTIKYDNVPVWERVRVGVYRELRTKLNGNDSAPEDSKTSLQELIKATKLLISNAFYRNPFLSDEHQVLLYGSARRKLQSDGFWWDPYFDPIHDTNNDNDIDSMHVESFYNLTEGHYQPAKTEDLFYTDIVEILPLLKNKINSSNIPIENKPREKLKSAEQDLQNRLDIHIDIISYIKRTFQYRSAIIPLYQRLLSSVNPNIVFLLSSYSNQNLVEACQKMDITVVELQHGIINEQHFGYSYPKNETKEVFPDYLLVWGKFWKEGVDFPIANNNVIPVGNPYLEKFCNQYKNYDNKNQLLFISQNEVGEKLSKLAVELQNHSKFEYNIVYKLHPNEYTGWENDYPWLADSGVRVVDDPDSSLYELFSQSKAQVGVFSTAIYEGLCFNLETYLYECPTVPTLEKLLSSGDAHSISSGLELKNNIGNKENEIHREKFFKSDAAKNILTFLQDVSNNSDK